MKHLFRTTTVVAVMAILPGSMNLSIAIPADTSESILTSAFGSSGFTVGAYGDHHYSQVANSGSVSDGSPTTNQLALQLGYDYSGWLSLSSELDLAPAANGEAGAGIGISELSVGVQIFDSFGIHAGRVFVPSSLENLERNPIINRTVVNSEVANSVLPSGSADGIGIRGGLFGLDYAAYVADGLDVSAVSMSGRLGDSSPTGIDSGTSTAVMTRVSWDHQVHATLLDRVYVGGFAYAGSGHSTNWSGQTFSAETQSVALEVGADVGPVLLKGLAGRTQIQNASRLASEYGQVTPSHLSGLELQAQTSFFPGLWNHGLLSDLCLTPYIRYEYISSEASVSPVLAMATGDVNAREMRDWTNAWTTGLTVHPFSQIAIQIDYRNEYTNATESSNSIVNLGLGWVL